MPYLIRLCGGPADGQLITLTTQQPPDIYQVAVPRSVSLGELWRPDADSFYTEPYDIVHYYHMAIQNSEGEWVYASWDRVNQLYRQFNSPMYETPVDPSVISSRSPRMSGQREYPLDAIKREDTQRLLKQIDQVIEDE